MTCLTALCHTQIGRFRCTVRPLKQRVSVFLLLVASVLQVSDLSDLTAAIYYPEAKTHLLLDAVSSSSSSSS